MVAPLVEALIQGVPPPPGASAGEVARCRRMIRAAEHKRWQAGIVLKVSERAFGTGRMVPVTAWVR
jgi:NAD+ synthase (glutamine-hydrolysing)